MKYDYSVCRCDYGYMEDEVRGNVEPVDLVMWVKNGERTLEASLASINRCVPKESVNHKLVVDDGSRDNSVEIAKRLGWRVIRNEGRGISDAANTALKNIVSNRFCSFEQDVILSGGWFRRVVPLVRGNVVVASGVRVPFASKSLQNIGLYEAERFRGCQTSQFGRNLDNTCYNSEFLREIGGFPKLRVSPGVDCYLFDRVQKDGKIWLVDSGCVSNHVRRGVWDEMKHYYWYGKCQREINGSVLAYTVLFGRALFSPIRGVDIALYQGCLGCVLAYPALRFSGLVGAVRGLF